MRNYHSAALGEQRVCVYCDIGPVPVPRAGFFSVLRVLNGCMLSVEEVDHAQHWVQDNPHAKAETNSPAVSGGVESIAPPTEHTRGGMEILASEILAQQQQHCAHLAQSHAQEEAMKQRV